MSRTPGNYVVRDATVEGMYEITPEHDIQSIARVTQNEYLKGDAFFNAKLFAAAPRLLDELKELVAWCASTTTMDGELDGARQAIAEAEGLA